MKALLRNIENFVTSVLNFREAGGKPGFWKQTAPAGCGGGPKDDYHQKRRPQQPQRPHLRHPQRFQRFQHIKDHSF